MAFFIIIIDRMSQMTTLEVPVQGMDCADCTRHVQHAIAGLPGVQDVEVYLTSEKALVRLDPAQVDLPAIRQAVKEAGYTVPESWQTSPVNRPVESGKVFTRQVFIVLGLLFGVILLVLVGETLGLLDTFSGRIPWWLGLPLVLAAGYPVFRKVVVAALHKQVISHTLMTLGVLAAALVGEWLTALVVVFFMRVGDTVEHFTAERARQALKNLAALSPEMARVERGGAELEIPAAEVQVGETVIVRPGEKIPVDGEVVSGSATVDQASITGEPLPVEMGPGGHVYAATIAQLGSLRVKAISVGPDTTYGHILRLVEHAEAHRAPVQRIADRFSAYYLPVVAVIATLTLLISRDPLATAAVLVVACSCAFALATPIAMMASIGAGAQHGMLIKGGKYLEQLARADVVLIDKTGTLTLGRPEISEAILFDHTAGLDEARLLSLVASAERYSEHPLARAVRQAALKQGLALAEPQDFSALPGLGVRARVDGRLVEVGSGRLAAGAASLDASTATGGFSGAASQPGAVQAAVQRIQDQGHSLLFVSIDGVLAGLLAVSDARRPEVPDAVQLLRAAGIQTIELLTGDHERSAALLAGDLGIPFRAGLLPQDKIAIVQEYQAAGHVVVMIGDGVNDAPALAQADVGIAMGAAGADVAIEAAHVALLRDDWCLVPEVFEIARRTMRVVKFNIGFTAVYNVIGLTLAAFGLLPPVLAAAAQSIPDLGILANSSRLLRYKD